MGYSFIDDPRLGSAVGRMFNPVLLLDLPVLPGPNHDGGKVIIGPNDKNVYTGNGDVNRQTQAQKTYVENVYKDPKASYGINASNICQVYSRTEIEKWEECSRVGTSG